MSLPSPTPQTPDTSASRYFWCIGSHAGLGDYVSVFVDCGGECHVITLNQSEASIQVTCSLSANQRPVSSVSVRARYCILFRAQYYFEQKIDNFCSARYSNYSILISIYSILDYIYRIFIPARYFFYKKIV